MACTLMGGLLKHMSIFIWSDDPLAMSLRTTIGGFTKAPVFLMTGHTQFMFTLRIGPPPFSQMGSGNGQMGSGQFGQMGSGNGQNGIGQRAKWDRATGKWDRASGKWDRASGKWDRATGKWDRASGKWDRAAHLSSDRLLHTCSPIPIPNSSHLNRNRTPHSCHRRRTLNHSQRHGTN